MLNFGYCLIKHGFIFDKLLHRIIVLRKHVRTLNIQLYFFKKGFENLKKVNQIEK